MESEKILKFEASWCVPCQMISKNLEGEDLGVELVKIDIDENHELAEQYNIRGVPTLVYIKNDKPVSTKVGLFSLNEIKRWVEKNKN